MDHAGIPALSERGAPTTESLGSLKDVPNESVPGYLARLSRLGDVVWDPDATTWFVSSYDLAKRICMGDETEFRTNRIYDPEFETFGLTEAEWFEVFLDGSAKKLGGMGGAEHERLRRWWFRAFSPKVLSTWQNELIEPIANACIDTFVRRGRVELRTEYCDPVIFEAITAILGLPSKSPEWFREYKKLGDGQANTTQLTRSWGSMAEVAELNRRMYALIEPSVLAKRERPGDDFASMVWRDAAEIFGEGYAVSDVVDQVMNALGGGIRSTDNVAGSSLGLMLTEPELQDRVVAGGDAALKRMVEEALRLCPHVWSRPRRVLTDVDLGGTPLHRGDLVAALIYSANRDARHYPAADRVDLERPAPNDHLSFFLGARACAGQTLARFVIQRVLNVALQRLPNLRPDPGAPPPRLEGRYPNWVFRPLHARFDA